MFGKPQKERRSFATPIALLALVIAVLALTVGGAYAIGLIPGSDIVPHSITKKQLSHEIMVKLNKKLKPGPTGSEGAAGKEGASGKNGSNGVDGKAGENGKEGPEGKKGEKGDTGSTGSQGPKGDQGDPGSPGTPGSPGATGPVGPQGPAGSNAVVHVTSLSGEWEAREGTDGGSNGSAPAPTITSGGAQLGPYVDGAQYSSVNFHGIDGKQLKEVAAIKYVASYVQQGTDYKGGSPYFRFITHPASEPNEVHHIIFSPNTQPENGVSSGRTQTWDVLKGGVRYDNDEGSIPDESWNKLIEEHGEEVIQDVNIQTGDGGLYSSETTALVKSLFVDVAGKPTTFYEFTTE